MVVTDKETQKINESARHPKPKITLKGDKAYIN